jgi:hypothetical protein
MALKLVSFRVKQAVRLSGCFSLLLYTLSGLMFQGEVWLLAGALCWSAIVSCFLINYVYRYHSERLQQVSFKTEREKKAVISQS